MSFELADYETAFNRFYDEMDDDLHLQDEVLRMFPIVRVEHSGSTRLQSKPRILEEAFSPHKNAATGNWDMILETDANALKSFLLDLMIPIQESKRRHTEEIITRTADATGNNIDARNRNIWDAYIEMIEKVTMRFDENGNAQFVIYPPAFREKLLKAEPPETQQKSRIEEIFAQKRAEFLAKAKRRLS